MMTDAPAQSCQPECAEVTPQELATWADEAQEFIDGGTVPMREMRKANATVAALRSHASLKERIEVLETALRPFSEIAPFVAFTDYRDGNVVHRQYDREGKRHELTKDNFRSAAAALATEPKPK